MALELVVDLRRLLPHARRARLVCHLGQPSLPELLQRGVVSATPLVTPAHVEIQGQSEREGEQEGPGEFVVTGCVYGLVDARGGAVVLQGLDGHHEPMLAFRMVCLYSNGHVREILPFRLRCFYSPHMGL